MRESDVELGDGLLSEMMMGRRSWGRGRWIRAAAAAREPIEEEEGHDAGWWSEEQLVRHGGEAAEGGDGEAGEKEGRGGGAQEGKEEIEERGSSGGAREERERGWIERRPASDGCVAAGRGNERRWDRARCSPGGAGRNERGGGVRGRCGSRLGLELVGVGWAYGLA